MRFFVLSLPRSRSLWMSKFLSTDRCKVEHDGSMNYSSIEELLRSRSDGNCDTGLVLHWKNLRGKIVLIERNYSDVCAELESIGLPGDTYLLRKALDAFNEAKQYFPTFSFESLNREDICKWIFEYLTEEPFDRDRWLLLSKIKYTVDVQEELIKTKSTESKWKTLYKEFL